MISVTSSLLIRYFFQDFLKILVIGILFSILSVIYTLSIENKYTSSATLASNLSDSKSISGSMGGLGNIASLAGISLGGDSLSPEVLKEMLYSDSFIAEFVEHSDLKEIIFAATSYDYNNKSFNFNDSIYNNELKRWTRDVQYPLSQEPKGKEVATIFKKHVAISYERKTKLTKVSYQSLSPELSESVVYSLVTYFNEYMRTADTENFETSIEFLNQELGKAGYSEIKIALQKILGEQYKKLSLAKTRKEYAYRFIEKPMLSDKKSDPKRAIICLMITLSGTFLFVLLLWGRRIYKG